MKLLIYSIAATLCTLAAHGETTTAAIPAPAWLADNLADLIQGVVPKHYEKKTDWGRTKRITTGLDIDGKPFHYHFKRRKRDVAHGTWKWLRASVARPDPTATHAEPTLEVIVHDLRSVGAGRAACTVELRAKLDLWARVRRYNRGVHLGTLTTHGNCQVVATLDCEVGFGVEAGESLPALVVDPKVTRAEVALVDLDLDRVGELGGEFADQTGRGLEKLIESQLTSEKLTAKINHSIDKRRERLKLDPSAAF